METLAFIIKLLGNLIPAAFGIYAIRIWKSEAIPRAQLLSNMGINPFKSGQFILGLLLGFLVFLSLFLLYQATGNLEIISFSWSGGNALTTILMFTAGAIGEELIFRSFFINGLRQFRLSDFTILFITAIFFAIVHLFNAGASALTGFSAFIGGLMYGYAFIRTNKLWLPIGLHFAWNFSQSFIFGFPVSGYQKEGLFTIDVSGNELVTGGAYGPEGSIPGIIMRVFVIVVIAVLFKQASKPVDTVPG